MLPAWKSYFKRLHQPTPEGALGTNPAMLAQSDKLNIIYKDVTAKKRLNQRAPKQSKPAISIKQRQPRRTMEKALA